MKLAPSIDKQDIRNLSYEELVIYLETIGEKQFRAGQIFDWIYKKGALDFNAMANLPASLKAHLLTDFLFGPPQITRHLTSEDKTQKFLFDLVDHEKVETVLIPTAHRATVCVSTQSGCKFGCRFCASGIGGWTRNLTSAEILEQILYARASLESAQGHPLSHIVFMGTGEPLTTLRYYG